MKSEELVNATIKALTEGVVRKRTKKTETKKLEEKETNLVSSYDFKNDKTNPIWIVGTVTSNGKTYKVNAKVFLEGSEFGIDNGPISKLWIQGTDEKDYKPIVNYDRGWDTEPSKESKALYNEIMKLLVDFRNANPYEVDETQEPKTESVDYKSAAKEINDISTEEIVNNLVKEPNCDKRLKDIAEKYQALAKVNTKLDDDKYIELDNEAEEIIAELAGVDLLENKKIEETVRFTAYGKTYYEMSEEEYDNKSDEEIQNIIIDTADQATEEEGHTVETDEVEILFENKSLVEKRNKYKINESKLQEEWFGVKDATYKYNGEWSDPMVKYRGYLYDYYDISDYVYNCMIEDYKEEGKELPPENSKEYDDIFNKYMYDEVENALIDLWPYKIDPDIIDYIEDGVVAGNAAEFIKKASNVDTSFEGVISRLESLKDNTDIPEKKIDEAIKVLKDDNVDKSDIVDADDRLDELMPIVIEIISKVDDFGDYMYENKGIKTESENKLKLSDGDIEYLKKIGHTDEDIPQIEEALNNTIYKVAVTETKDFKIEIPDESADTEISAQEARDILGDDRFLSGLSRSAFHYTSGRYNYDETLYVSFDSSKLFEESKERKIESKKHYECPQCGLDFPKEDLIKVDVQDINVDSGESLDFEYYECPECEYRITAQEWEENKLDESKSIKKEASFDDKVKAIKKSLKQKDKRLSDETAEKSAKNIAGSMIKNESVDNINIEEDISKTFNPSFDAFVNNFGKIYIIKDKYDKLYKVYKENKLGIDDYIYYANNKDQILGFLDGAIKANNGVFNK